MKNRVLYRGHCIEINGPCIEENSPNRHGFLASIYVPGDPTPTGSVFMVTETAAIEAAMKEIDLYVTIERVTIWEEIVRIKHLPPWTFCPQDPHNA